MSRRGRDAIASGLASESLVASWLTERGFRIEARNYRCRMGELDLVARHRDVLVFVEVKARGVGAYGRPAEAVSSRKRARLIRAATHYLLRFGSKPPACRFDVVEVLLDGREDGKIIHTMDAFRPGWR
jgi:putative endonuclease